MELVLGILANEAVFNLLSNGILLGVSAIMGKLAMTHGHEAKVRRAKDAVAAGVADLYPVVKVLKAANSNKKLTEAQRSEMQARALTRASEIGKEAGVDIFKTLGPTLAKTVLEQTVSSFKAGRKKEIVLQPGTAALLPDTPPEGWGSPKAL